MWSFQNGGNQKTHLIALGSVGKRLFVIKWRSANVIAEYVSYFDAMRQGLNARGIKLLKLGNVIHDRVHLRREGLQLAGFHSQARRSATFATSATDNDMIASSTSNLSITLLKERPLGDSSWPRPFLMSVVMDRVSLTDSINWFKVRGSSRVHLF